MKTFDEALHLITGLASDTAGMKASAETFGRYQSLLADMQKNPRFRNLIEEMYPDLAVREGVFSAFATAFANGLIVGMEMEKSDALEAIPSSPRPAPRNGKVDSHG